MGIKAASSRKKPAGAAARRAPVRPRATMAGTLFTATQQRVLGLLFGQPERSFFATELIALAGAGSGAVQREIKRLAESGLATVTRIGNQKHYQANRAAPIFEELCGIALKMLVAPEALRSAPAEARALHSPQAAYQVSAPRPKLHIPRSKLAALCRKYRVRKLSLFGSAARNEMTPASDVDVLVEFEPGSGTSLLDIPALQEELSTLFGGRKVDVATPEILENPFRRKAILPELRTLYAA